MGGDFNVISSIAKCINLSPQNLSAVGDFDQAMPKSYLKDYFSLNNVHTKENKPSLFY